MPSAITRELLQSSLNQYFGSIPDPRVDRTRAHQLLDIISIALFAVLSGADGWVGIETYGLSKQAWLETFLQLPNGIPSHDTFARVFSRLEPSMLESSFQQWVSLLASNLDGQVIAIDGKTLKGSYDREQGVKTLQLVSAWASKHRLVLGQCAVETKSNEITAIPVLLEQLDVTGAIITLDAMGTQTAIAQQIEQAEADYILALKHNHPTLATLANQWFAKHRDQAQRHLCAPDDIACEGGHHRIETRTLWQVPASEVFSQKMIAGWPGLKTLVVVESTRRLWSHNTQQVRFFISSLTVAAETFAQYIRCHWGIENQLHWCLDVTFKEDGSRIRKEHAPLNMSLMRRLALNLLRQESSTASLKMKRYRAAMDNEFLTKILADASMI